MKTQSKAVFLMLATLAASTSANEPLSRDLEEVLTYEDEALPSEVLQTIATSEQFAGFAQILIERSDEWTKCKKKCFDKEDCSNDDGKCKSDCKRKCTDKYPKASTSSDEVKVSRDLEEVLNYEDEALPSDVLQTIATSEQFAGFAQILIERSEEWTECKKKCFDKNSCSNDDGKCKSDCKRKCTDKYPDNDSGDSDSGDEKKCLDNEKPTAKRNGDKYKFELEKKDAQCVDKKDRTYEFGQFKDVKTFSDCAEKCVKDVRSSLLNNFQGFDFDCKKKRCNCLYDQGTLDSKNSDRFDRTERNEDGKGKVKSATKKKETYCGKLTNVKFVGLNDEFEDEDVEMEGRRVLRGAI